MKIKNVLSLFEGSLKFTSGQLNHDVTTIHQEKEPTDEIFGFTQKASEVQEGFAFFAIKGASKDGHDYINEAIQRKARLIILEKYVPIESPFTGLVFEVPNSRKAFALMASAWFDHPSHNLFCVGVTGTNGKTSTVYMLEHILNELRIPTGVLGTIDHHLFTHTKNFHWNSQLTTPEPYELQSRLQEMKEGGAKVIAMEVSSHALSQERVYGVEFDAVLFTNLSQDHLDFHKNLKNYFLEKQKLFTDLLWDGQKYAPFAIVNIDDPWGKKLEVASKASLWTFGQTPAADIRFEITKKDLHFTDYVIHTSAESLKGRIPLCGVHNVYNAVGVIILALSAGVPLSTSIKILETFPGVPGRLQKIKTDAFTNPNLSSVSLEHRHHENIFIDYAHTPDALEKVLLTLKELKKDDQNLWIVFGCGGDRDTTKRPLMAGVAEKWSDFVVMTSDNPRTEPPDLILDQMMVGIVLKRGSAHVFREVDRRKAIQFALKQAQENDIILIAGKGHEDYQIIGQDKIPFSDQIVVENYYQMKGE